MRIGFWDNTPARRSSFCRARLPRPHTGLFYLIALCALLRVYGPILRHSVMSQSPAWSSSLEFELGLLLFPVVPSFLKSCMKLCVFFMLVSFATLTGGDGCRRATTDEVRITRLAVLVAFVFHHLSYKLTTVTWVRCGGAIPPQASSSHIP